MIGCPGCSHVADSDNIEITGDVNSVKEGIASSEELNSEQSDIEIDVNLAAESQGTTEVQDGHGLLTKVHFSDMVSRDSDSSYWINADILSTDFSLLGREIPDSIALEWEDWDSKTPEEVFISSRSQGVSFFTTPDRSIKNLSIQTGYRDTKTHIRLQLNMVLNCDEQYVSGWAVSGQRDFEHITMATRSGNCVEIIIASETGSDTAQAGNTAIIAYWVEDNVFFLSRRRPLPLSEA